jgi:DNA-binding GntR family transcriptional regulator
VKPEIAKRSDVPLYTQVVTIIRMQIDYGELRPGERLRSETELALDFQVSRATIRQALDELGRDGLIRRVVGRGTFILQTPAPKRVSRAPVTFHNLQQQLAKSTQTILKAGTAGSPPIVETCLNLDPGEKCTFSIRVLKSGRNTWGAVKHYFHPTYASLLQQEREHPLPILQQLSPELKKSHQIGANWFEAIIAEPRFAMMLKVSVGSPILSVWWVDNLDGRPALCSQMILPGPKLSIRRA